MESRLTSSHGRSGFALITVLIVTAIGLLFGAGALLLFRYQCQMRIDRQHELEKMYAVRSALNFIRMQTIGDAGQRFGYRTGSGRDLGVFIKPAKTYFPITNGVNELTQKIDFVMERGDLRIPNGKWNDHGGYNIEYDYEYGAEGVTNLCLAIANQEGAAKGVVFNCAAASSDCSLMKCWVNIGMSATGGWLESEYGRRYCFEEALRAHDIVRLWIIRNPENVVDGSDGQSFGWPPANDKHPLMLELQKLDTDTSKMELHECEGITPTRCLCQLAIGSGDYLVGLQLAHDKASIFYVKNDAGGSGLSVDVWLRGYVFSNVGTLSTSTYDYYYRGSELNGEGKIVRAPQLRAVLEFNANPNYIRDKNRYLTKFKVTPGYQYDISLIYANGKTNLATVAQRMGVYQQGVTGSTPLYSVLTYDTHGTENKGFRKDEREAARRQQGQ